jgi:eukaryotic-like serine/threonine-protein kinase
MPGSLFHERYEIVRVVGQGAMGIVYAARDVRTGRLVALKLMNQELASEPRFVERFEEEARVGQRIRSPHVAEVFDSGWSSAPKSSEKRQPFFAMELLEGETLEARLGREELGRELAIEVIRQLFAGLAAAHRAGIVHRDLKPENLFLCAREGDQPLVKVLDFGVAKVLRETTQGGTAPGLGTPLWTAPEQGKEGQVIRPSADVWALGLLTFRLLVGAVYWRSANQRGTTAFDLAVEMLRAPIVPPSQRAAELARAPLGSSASLFDAWFLRAVHREPAARFVDAGEAEVALAPILTELRGSGPKSSVSGRWRPWVVLLILVLTVGVVGAAIALR